METSSSGYAGVTDLSWQKPTVMPSTLGCLQGPHGICRLLGHYWHLCLSLRKLFKLHNFVENKCLAWLTRTPGFTGTQRLIWNKTFPLKCTLNVALRLPEMGDRGVTNCHVRTTAMAETVLSAGILEPQ